MNKLHVRKVNMINYLLMKIDEQDWHAVCDAANDLREIEVEIRIREEGQNDN